MARKHKFNPSWRLENWTEGLGFLLKKFKNWTIKQHNQTEEIDYYNED